MRTFSKHRAPSTTTPLICSNSPRKQRDRSRFSQQRRTCCPCWGRPVPRVSLKLTESLFPWLEKWLLQWTETQMPIKSQIPQELITDIGRVLRAVRCFSLTNISDATDASGLWTALKSPRPRGGFYTIYGCYPPGRLTPGHNWELTSLPASSTWKHKITTKTKGSSMLWAFEMPKTKLRGYFKEILKEWMWGPALPPSQGPR